MKGLARTDQEAIVYKLFVLAENGAFYNPVSAVGTVVEQGVADMFHVYAYLVGTAGLQPQFYQCHIVKPLQHFVVCDGFFAMFSIGEGCHLLAVALVAADMRYYRAFIVLHIAPYQGNIPAVDGVFFELRRHALHAKELGMKHPATGEWIQFDSELPKDIQEVIEKWRTYTSGMNRQLKERMKG